MADYPTSTQRRKWLLSASDIAERRLAVNLRAGQSLRKKGCTKVDVSIESGERVQEEVENEAPSQEIFTFPEPLTPEQEFIFCKYYETKIQQVCSVFRFPVKVQTTAILYFKRFFLSWSVMEMDVKQIMLTCIYLACKIEESYVSAEQLGRGIKQDPQVVLSNELILLQTLNFDLISFGPHRSLDAFLLELEDLYSNQIPNLSPDLMKGLKSAAYSKVDLIMLTNAPFIYPPAQLALAALMMAIEESFTQLDFHRFVSHITGRNGDRDAHDSDSLMEIVDRIKQTVLSQCQVPPQEEVNVIDRVIKYCRNPVLAQDERKKRERKQRHKSKASNGGEGEFDRKRRKSID